MSVEPELRFKEFSDDWEEKKLGEIANINPKSENLPDNFIYIDLKSVENGILKQKNQVSKENAPSRAQRILEIDDILFQTVRPYQKNNLFFNFKDEHYVSSTGYAQLRAVGNPNFLFQIIHKETFVNEVLKRCTGTSYPAINSNDLKQISLKFPSIEEQEKIANFLSKIDEKIAILEEKLRLWEKYKKGIMQLLFSKRLRFKDDDGNSYPDWEEKFLKDIAKIEGGGTPDTKNPYYWDGDINWFTPTEIGETKYVFNSLRKISNQGFEASSTKLLPKGTVLLSSRATIGFSSISQKECTTNQGFQSLIVNNKNSNEFVYYLIKSLQKDLIRKASGSTFLEISKKDLSKIKIHVPLLNEQENIASFLEIIDKKIEKINKEFKTNKDFKKGLLKKMFS